MRLRTILVIAPAALLAGCSSLLGPQVGCNEESTTKLVKQIVLEAVATELDDPRVKDSAAYIGQELELAFSAVRANSFDEAVHRYSCEASLAISLPPIALQRIEADEELVDVMRKNGVTLAADGIVAQLSYTSQPADDGEHQYVEVKGHQAVAETVLVTALMGGFESDNQASSAVRRTMEGVVDSGSMLATLALDEGEGFMFDPNSEVGSKILTACGVGTRCRVDGEVDGDHIVRIHSAELR